MSQKKLLSIFAAGNTILLLNLACEQKKCGPLHYSFSFHLNFTGNFAKANNIGWCKFFENLTYIFKKDHDLKFQMTYMIINTCATSFRSLCDSLYQVETNTISFK